MRPHGLPGPSQHGISGSLFEAHHFALSLWATYQCQLTLSGSQAWPSRRFHQNQSLGYRPRARSIAYAAETGPRYFSSRGAASQALRPMGPLRRRARRNRRRCAVPQILNGNCRLLMAAGFVVPNIRSMSSGDGCCQQSRVPRVLHAVHSVLRTCVVHTLQL
ncbi:hypothetical protein BC834DRAFT_326408 [Gloeopeniophorella convolvens]|nr:hypothetical protein BC834DRAFT_326408 [Gloeopeniophorella convolvens]